ncbi:amino acid adenylation domain-containing protein [Streptomyces niveiscabiei]|uniref:amino acid adenylation domain-containing protein n=1 Tax=Streptomyces niveiscabiei TaxID=164115 RepID=UPI0029BF1CC5|nr:amino acid adenylation domain-containing protein [Streptomyces niveiscabiei]MDX3382375.1 amino acid adenylation domain-containing protein [Streptomyces niveiscabiei]
MVTLDGAFRRWVRETPDAVALESADGVLTYRELDARAGVLARRLARYGVRPGELVGIAARPSPWFVVTMLAVVRAGAAYVPLDLSYPAERLAHMCRDSGVRVLVADSADGLAGGLAGCEVLVPDRLTDGPGALPEPVEASPADLAYAVYTSGSTGLPKAVLVEQRNVLAFCLGQDFVNLGPGRSMLRTSSFSFDASVLETWGVLLRGARLVFPPDDMYGAGELAEVLAAHRVTDLWLSVGLFHQVVDDDPAAFASLRTVVTGGDVVSPQRVRRALAAGPGLTVAHVYGPTETTVICGRHLVSDPDRVEAPLPLGGPIPGARFHVVDEAGRVLPPGEIGELWIAGATVSRGYHGRAELTAQRFVTEPGTRDGRAYRSGDLARRRADGVVEFHGRADRQVKVRGFRVEPGEIEAALLDVAGVRACLAVAREAPPGDKRIVAYVVPEAGARLAAADAHAVLAGRLPAHMLPAEYVALDALPLDVNGKPDRHRLPEPEWGRGQGAVLAAPAGPVIPFERI